jgi:hypothetical protein
MIEARQRTGLAHQPSACLGIETLLVLQDLERYAAVQRLIEAGVDGAHTAVADLLGNTDVPIASA